MNLRFGRDSFAPRDVAMKIGLGWGLIDQGFSSATNFAVSVLAGRLLGPRGLGTVFVGFAAYLIVLEFQQSLLQEPFAVTSAVAADGSPTRSALTVGLMYQVLASAAMAGIGFILPGSLGHGMRLVAPWIIPLLFQDLCRTILFKDRRGAAAAGCDAVWAVAMALALPLALTHRSAAAVVACWGIGAVAGGVYGAVKVGLRPHGLGVAWVWWRGRISPLARWLAMESAGLVIGTQGTVFLIAALVGTGKLGGLRAVQSAFAPMTLVGPAIRMPGLPAIARALHGASDEEGQKAARNIAMRLSGAATVMVVAYFLVLVAIGGPLLSSVFGKAFVRFRTLILPVGLGQLAGASAIGYYLLLKASGRGRAVFWTRMVTAVAKFGFIGLLAAGGSVSGAAWGSSIGAAAGWVAVAATALRRRPQKTRSADGGARSEEVALVEPRAFGAEA